MGRETSSGQFADAVRTFVSSGGDYYGGSAGAVLACESIAIAEGHGPNEVGLTDLTGLGLLDRGRGTASLHPRPARPSAGLVPCPPHNRPWAAEKSGLDCQDTSADITGTGTLLEISAEAVREHTPGRRLHLTR